MKLSTNTLKNNLRPILERYFVKYFTLSLCYKITTKLFVSTSPQKVSTMNMPIKKLEILKHRPFTITLLANDKNMPAMQGLLLLDNIWIRSIF